ncbi:MAG: hypothetical protein EP343_21355 [Deltaproteobacteria bacterium]|nr:MAG: hypothetical protein EP343_21355 [Deltaproteobacteria bacterium]
MLPNKFFIQYLLEQRLIHPDHLRRAQEIQMHRGGDLIDILFGMMAMQREQHMLRHDMQHGSMHPMQTHASQELPEFGMVPEEVGAPAVAFRDLSQPGVSQPMSSPPAPQVWGNSPMAPNMESPSGPRHISWPSAEELEAPMIWSAAEQPLEARGTSHLSSSPANPLPEPLPIPFAAPPGESSGTEKAQGSASSLRSLFNTLQTIVGIELPEESFRALENAYDALGENLDNKAPALGEAHPWLEEMVAGVDHISYNNLPSSSEVPNPLLHQQPSSKATPATANPKVDPRIAAAVDNRYSSDAIPAPQLPAHFSQSELSAPPSKENYVPYRINGGHQPSSEEVQPYPSRSSRETDVPKWGQHASHSHRSHDSLPLIQGTPLPQLNKSYSRSSSALPSMAPATSSSQVMQQVGYKSRELPSVSRTGRSSAYSLAPVIEGVATPAPPSRSRSMSMSSARLASDMMKESETTHRHWQWILLLSILFLGASIAIGLYL